MIKSDSLAQLGDALSKAQGAMGHAKKESANPFFKSKYADLASVRDACSAELAANGLAVVQLPTMREGKLVLEYVLIHSSGEFIGSELELTPVKSDPQGIGSAITYARRYTLSGLAGVATEDDDGNAASGKGPGQIKEVTRTTEDIPIGGKPKAVASHQEGATAAAVDFTDFAMMEAVMPGADKPTVEVAKKVLMDVKEIQAEAKRILSVKPAELPEGCIEQGQAVNFAKLFKDSLKPQLRANASDIEHAWLKKQGIVDGDGNGTAKAIRKENFYQVREEGIAYAAALEAW